jgi:hypothetical protein
MPIIEIALIQVRRGQEYQTGVPQLQPGEMAWAEDTENLYIGKRIVEGASNNLNSRILTDKDLNSIFQIAQASVAQANSSTAYRYRGDIPYGNQPNQLMSTTSTYANKLNNWVSLTDFNPVWPPYANPGTIPDITTILQNAIGLIDSDNIGSGVIFQNGSTVPVGPNPIKIPAGIWKISSTINLPPYTTLIGDGIGMTVLIYSGANDMTLPMFQTVDANGKSFSQNMEVANGQNANFINLQNMSLNFPKDFTATSTLISLDNVKNVYFENLYIGSTSSSIQTTGTSVGIRIRTSGIAPDDLTLANSENINITHCIFNGVSTAIDNNGTVNKINIKDNKFSWLINGIKSMNTVTTVAGINGVIDNNKFENITREAIVIGTSTNAVKSYIISTNNSFRNVGCGNNGESNQITNVIKINDLGYQSVDDFFDRQVSTPNNVYMYPWVSNNASVINSTPYQVSISSSSTVNVIKIPLTSNVQLATFDYTLSNVDMFRSGQLVMNIAPAADTFANVGDNYAFGERVEFTNDLIAFSTNYTAASTTNYISLTCSNFGISATSLEYKLSLLN